MADKDNAAAMQESRAADLKVRKQDYMVIGLGIIMLIVAKIMA
ncbi:hypothetical protein [Desulfotomaculum sp. 1211_IL3151]